MTARKPQTSTPLVLADLGTGDTATMVHAGADRRVRCSWHSGAGVNQWTFVRLWVVPVPGDGEAYWGRPFSIASDTPVRAVVRFAAPVASSADATAPIADPLARGAGDEGDLLSVAVDAGAR